MTHTYSKITAPVNTDDVCTVLGESVHDVKTLCMSPKINPWAKYKPEVIDRPDSINLVLRKNNNFGLAPETIYSGATEFINAVRSGIFNGGWIYRGVGINDWGRLDDFDGYDHNATPPFGSLVGNTFLLTDSSLSKLTVPARIPAISTVGDTDSGYLNINDFNGSEKYGEWYFGVLLCNSSRALIATMPDPIGNNQSWQVDFGHVGTSYRGSYTGVPFLSEGKYTNGGVYPSKGRIVGIGYGGVDIILTTTADLYKVLIQAHYESNTSRTVSWQVSIYNNSTSSRKFSDVTLQFATDGSGSGVTFIASMGDITVAAGDVWRHKGTFYASHSNFSHARVYYDSTVRSDWQQFMKALEPIVPVVPFE